MLRTIAYGIAGTSIGTVVGLFISAVRDSSTFGFVGMGAVLGLVCAIGLSAYVSYRHLLSGPFIRERDIHPLSVSADITMRGILPKKLREQVIDWLRSKLVG